MQSFAEKTIYMPHRPVLEMALNYLDNLPKVAIDCGCGAGNEIEFLLKKDFTVYAFDYSSDAEYICQNRFKGNQKLHFCKCSFAHYDFVQASLITAFFSIFFLSSNDFFNVLKKIEMALVSNGIFVLNLLGTNDDWVKQQPDKFIGFSETQLNEIFGDQFEIINLDHLQEKRLLANGQRKFWDLYTIILKRKPSTSFKHK